ncbi:MAG: Ig-like domain-containing protein [Clostridia bacterium]|jgi:hypothetical protein
MFRKTVSVLCTLLLIFSQCIFISVSAADKTAPLLKAATPKNNQAGVTVNTKISLKFGENIYKSKYFSKIKLTKFGKTTSIKSSISKNYLNISHKYFLAYSSNYTILIPAYSVRDKAGNILKKPITIKFKTKAKIIKPTPTVTPTITPTPSPTVTPTPVPSGLRILDNLATYFSTNITDNWISDGINIGTENTGECFINFDITPLTDNVNATVNLADSRAEITEFDDLPMSIRFNNIGKVDVKNGKTNNEYVVKKAFQYSANTKYHVKIAVHTIVKTYCAWIIPEGGAKVQIAGQYGFVTTAADLNDTGKLFLISGDTDKKIRVENFTIASADTVIPTEQPGPTNGATPSPTPTGIASADNNLEITAALNDANVGTIVLDADSSYTGFTISRTIIIQGNGANFLSGIQINSSNVTIDNINVTASTSLVTNPMGEADLRHGYRIAPGRKGIVIKNGSVTGGTDSTVTKGIFCVPSSASEITIEDVAFSELRNGIVCGGKLANGIDFAGASLTLRNSSFTNVAYAIGSTENTTIVELTGNTFTNGTEGIGLGSGINITADGQNAASLVLYLKTNNTFNGYALNEEIKDYRTP